MLHLLNQATSIYQLPMHPQSLSPEFSYKMNQVTAFLGMAASGLLCISLVVFSSLNPEFDIVNDYVSKLGAKGQPFALYWNLIGFVSVGLLLTGFGWAYGQIVDDRILRSFLVFFGLGYAVTGVPADMADSWSHISRIHTAAICLALGAWLLGLARLVGLEFLGRRDKIIANIAAILLVSAIAGYALGLWSMPFTHRLVFGTVFGWVSVTSVRLLNCGS